MPVTNTLRIEQQLMILSGAIADQHFEMDTERVRAILIAAAEAISDLRRNGAPARDADRASIADLQ